MRRISLVGVTMFVAFVMAVFLSLLVVTEAKSASGSVSQGSAVNPDSRAATAAQKDLAEEDGLPDYTQVVDDTTEGRFLAPGWQKRSGNDWSHGESYVSPGPQAETARFKVKIPTTNDYSVYAWWPEASANSTRARYGVGTASGTKWSEIDQRTEGGMWIKLGTYAMKKGERYVEVSPEAEGDAVADAVAVVRGEAVLPPEDEAPSGDLTARSTSTDTKASQGSGYAVVRAARRHIGDRYAYGTCTSSRKSCTCVTKKATSPFGHNMPMTELGQWRYSRSVFVRYRNLQPGDEVFFKENGRSGPITHVGIYSGNGNLVHASTYFGKVTESKMKYVTGYAGAKRFRF